MSTETPDRGAVISFRISEKEAIRLRNAAKATGRKVSDMVRDRIADLMAEPRVPVPPPPVTTGATDVKIEWFQPGTDSTEEETRDATPE